VFRGIFDKTFSNSVEYRNVINYWKSPDAPVAVGNTEYDQIKNSYIEFAINNSNNNNIITTSYNESNENLFDMRKLAMRHTRYYNDGSCLSLGIVLIDDYGFIQELPKPDANPIDKAIWLIDVVLNTNVELMVKSNQFADQKMGIDIVSKMLWWMMLNPQNSDNTTPINEEYLAPESYKEPKYETTINP
jgi:hypothetical protein